LRRKAPRLLAVGSVGLNDENWLCNGSALRKAQPMSRTWTFVIVFAAWTAIYLPGLGSLEIKGEEGRRILPAVSMLETGNYVIPQVGSEPYFRKPPLVNWLVALSFKLFGRQNEWTARLPSTLSVLAVALAFITVARFSLGANGSLIAAIIWLTNFGIIEKGRLIEIEAIYVSLCGLAIICWLSWWQQRRSPWLTWTVPWIFLALGLLAKGPLLLIFFYAVIVAMLWRAREIHLLWSGPHFAGILLMVAIFLAWAVPCLEMANASHVTQTWSRQFSGRLTGEDFKLYGWFLNIPRSLGYFLPWALLLPFLRFNRLPSEEDRKHAFALAWSTAISFVAISLLPGSLPRYTMPLLAPVVWLLAFFLSLNATRWPQRPLRVVLFVAAIVSAAVIAYAVAIVPLQQRHQKVKLIAAQINAVVPASETLYAINPAYQPFLFYVQRKLIYMSEFWEVPVSARYLFIQLEKEPEVEATDHWQPLKAQPILRITDYRNRHSILLKIGER
jgi:4-amino-4-deoxy-L-arabinose transferase-like glycosyltransferase